MAQVLYLLYSPKGTGAQSILHALKATKTTQPIVFTNDCQMFQIYNSKYLMSHLKNIDIIEEESDNPDYINISIYQDHISDFFDRLKQNFSIKIISALRNPVQRSISLLLQSLIETNESKEPYMKLDDVINTYINLFDKGILEEYKIYLETIKTLFNYYVNMKNDHFQVHNIIDNISFALIKIEHLDLHKKNLLDFLGISQDIIIPTLNTKYQITHYKFPRHQLQYIVNKLNTVAKNKFLKYDKVFDRLGYPLI